MPPSNIPPPPPVLPQPPVPAPPPKKRKWPLIVGILIVLVLVAGAAGYFVFINKSEPIVSQSPASQTPASVSTQTSATADYVKQHTLFLINEAPNPYQPSKNGPETSSIYTVHFDGTSKKLLTSDGEAPSWTPDGKIIFTSSRSGSSQIWIMDENGSNARQVGNLTVATQPLMPQMGTNDLIVFMGIDANTRPDNNVGIYTIQKDGSNLKKLTSGMQPFLALSGTWIAYTFQTDTSRTDVPYHREVWRINTDGTGQKQLTFLGDDPDYPDANAPNISPDEKTVAFFSGVESIPNDTLFTWGHRNVAIVPAVGGVRKTLTPCQPVTTKAELDTATSATGKCIAADNPAWSPDGNWLVFDTGFKDGTETWLVDLNGRNFQKFYPESRGTVRVPIKYVN